MKAPVNAVMPISACTAAMERGELSARSLTELCLMRIEDPAGEGARAFVRVDRSAALACADAQDALRASEVPAGKLAGIPVSVKDLFDIAGQTTMAGSRALSKAPVARRDAAAVTRLRQAGAIVVGRTNMTEFAYSGLGINPHYGTPLNPYDRVSGRIPGGSSAGGAVSVSDGMVAAALGSDTGGSVRIPAALCGLVGFKPTASRYPMGGIAPLSTSLDSVGVIAPTVDCCARLDEVLANADRRRPVPSTLRGLRIGVLLGFVQDGLDQAVSRCFNAALHALSEEGAQLTDVHSAVIERIPAIEGQARMVAAEAYEQFEDVIASGGEQIDPRVRSRILRGKDLSSADYIRVRRERERLIRDWAEEFDRFDIWLLPTVPQVAPLLNPLLSDDAAYFRLNAAMLRNPGLINFLDGCAISLPCHFPGEAPVGLMAVAPGGHDARLLNIAGTIEAALASFGGATHGRANYFGVRVA